MDARSATVACALLMALAQKSCSAQPFWGPAGFTSSLNGNYYSIYSGDDGTWVAYGGLRDFNPDSSGWQNRLVKVSAAGVEYIPVRGQVNSIVEYHDTLFLGGHFFTNPFGSDTIPAYNVVFWDGLGWAPLGVFNDWEVTSLRVLDDTLYAVGTFTEVDGQDCTGMIKLVNGAWQTLPPVPEPELGLAMTDIIKYDGQLIATGGIYIGSGNGIAYLDGTEWHILGPGLEAGFSSIHSMVLYDGELYVGGQISVTANNPGKDIMRWDGTQFHALGNGLRRSLDDYNNFTDCRALTVHDGLLWAGGGFRYAGDVQAQGVATWDGTDWCGVPGNLTVPNGAVKGIAFYEDTAFVICGYLADDDSVNQAAKFIGESYAGPCETDVSVAEFGEATTFNIFPNPATTNIRFAPINGLDARTDILDALGRVVMRLSGQVTELDVSAWPRGLYTVHSTCRPSTRFVLQ